MATPVVVVTSGGLPITVVTSGGVPMTIASNGFGIPVRVVASGGMPVVGVVTGPDVTAPVITSSNTLTVAENSVLTHYLMANEAVSWAKVGGADQALFTLASGVLTLPAQDYETKTSAVVQVQATDLASNVSAIQTITVTITNIDEVAPTITSANTFSTAENVAYNHTLTANETVTWSIVGGADAAQFSLAGAVLTLAAQDYEAGTSRVVQIRATDTAGNQTNQTITATITNVAEGAATPLFMFAGQSNMMSFGTDGQTVPTPIASMGAEVQLWGFRTAHAFAEYSPGTTSNDDNSVAGWRDNWGPEGEFARLRYAAVADTVWMVKRAEGSTSLAPSGTADWNVASGELYANLNTETALALAAMTAAVLPSPYVAYICWGQGESDSLIAVDAAAYYANLTALVEGWHALYPSARIGIMRIANAADWTYRSLIRSAQAQVAIDKTYCDLIDTDDIPLGGDNQHYTVAGVTTLATRFHAAWVAADTSADTTAPTVTSYVPADNGTSISTSVELVVTFSEYVTLGASGTVTLKKTSDNSTVDSWDVATDNGSGAGQLQIVANTTLHLHLTSALASTTEYYVVWTAGVVKDLANNNVAALSSTTAWSFTTAGAAWSPLTASTPAIWWVDPTSIVQSGGVVSQWTDLGAGYSGQSPPHNMTPDTTDSGTSPAYVASAINGLPGVSFTSNGNLKSAAWFAAQPFMLVIVWKQSSSAPNSYGILWDGSHTATGTRSALFSRHVDLSNHYIQFAGSVLSQGVVIAANSGPWHSRVLFDGSSSSTTLNGSTVSGDAGAAGMDGDGGMRFAGTVTAAGQTNAIVCEAYIIKYANHAAALANYATDAANSDAYVLARYGV